MREPLDSIPRFCRINLKLSRVSKVKPQLTIRIAIAPRGATWHSRRMATSSPRNPIAGGFLLAMSLIVGTVLGAGQGQASIGLVAGLGIGLTLLLATWLIDRRRR